jgi:hypothetical protein
MSVDANLIHKEKLVITKCEIEYQTVSKLYGTVIPYGDRAFMQKARGGQNRSGRHKNLLRKENPLSGTVCEANV